MARTLIQLPPLSRKGEVIEVRTMIAHPMETGYRPGADGKVLPRDLIRRFTCTYDDGSSREVVFQAELFPAVAANPYLTFPLLVTGPGTLTMAWEGDNGFSQTETLALRVA
ncbi:MAG: thiosulfate oxidation carrier complex protein SoxZ [Rhodoferax sp.]|jgi:sulfur-oxidizing protein SoxZ|nr:thiosulfate oxidation carrier complex protein SoxZ [Rhodoferax sp.]